MYRILSLVTSTHFTYRFVTTGNIYVIIETYSKPKYFTLPCITNLSGLHL